jgi:hypothetical protein
VVLTAFFGRVVENGTILLWDAENIGEMTMKNTKKGGKSKNKVSKLAIY